MAGDLIGALRVSLGLDTAAFEQGVKRSRDTAKRGSREIAGGFDSIKGSAIAAAAAVGTGLVAAFAAAAKSSFDYADAIADLSARTGASTKLLQEFRYAAQLTGSDVDSADDAVAKFARTLGLAQQGSAAQVKLFERLGVQIKDSNGQFRSLDDVLKDFADGVQRLSTDQERNAVTIEAMGRSAGSLAPLLSQGSAGLNTMAQRAAELGLVLDDQMIGQMGVVNDQLDTMQMVLRTQLVGAIGANVEGIASLAGAVGTLGTALVKSLGYIGNVITGFRAVRAESGLFGAMTASTDALAARGRQRSQVMAILRTPNTGQNGIRAANPPAASGSGVPVIRARGGGGGARRGGAPTAGFAEQVRRGDFDSLIASGPLTIVTPEELERVGQVAVNIGQIAADVPQISQSALFRANAFEAAAGFAEAMAQNIGQAVVFSGDIGKALVNSFKAAAAEVITSGLMDILLGGRGAGGRRGGGLIGSLLGIPGFANGTNYAPGGLAMVGERGRELVQLPRGSRVIPNGQTEAMMGGRQMHVTVGVDPRTGNLTAFVNNQIAATAPAIAQAGASIAQGQAAQRAQRRFR